MDNPEVIRHQMEETRAALTEKLENLENQVVETVQHATSAVTETVDTVKDAVEESVETVKESVSDTFDKVKEAFNLEHHVEQRPWAMFGGAVAVGFLAGYFFESEAAASGVEGFAPSSQGNAASKEFDAGRLDLASAPTALARSSSSRGWLRGLSDQFGPEVQKLKGLAIGTTFGLFRDLIMASLQPEVGNQVKEVLDSLTVKLGGQPIRGPLLKPEPAAGSERSPQGERLTPERSRPRASSAWQNPPVRTV